MSVPRLIPVLLHKNGRLVLSRQFTFHQDIGHPRYMTDRYKSWDLDELVYLDITPHWLSGDCEQFFKRHVDTVREVSRNCFIPLAVGGGIRTVDHMYELIRAGADRIVINTQALMDPSIITAAARTFGSQAVIVGVDVRCTAEGDYNVYSHGGRRKTEYSMTDWLRKATHHGAGEFFINNIDRDGMGTGYDPALVEKAVSSVNVPLIICGGAGQWQDMTSVLEQGAGAAAAANIYTFTELSYLASKRAVFANYPHIRPGSVGMNYEEARREREQGSRLGAEKTILWQELDKGGLME